MLVKIVDASGAFSVDSARIAAGNIRRVVCAVPPHRRRGATSPTRYGHRPAVATETRPSPLTEPATTRRADGTPAARTYGDGTSKGVRDGMAALMTKPKWVERTRRPASVALVLALAATASCSAALKTHNESPNAPHTLTPATLPPRATRTPADATETTTNSPRAAASTKTTTPPPKAPIACPPNLASALSWTGSARQLVTVEAANYGTNIATIMLWNRSANCWSAAAGPFTGFVGYNGFSDHKHEGDGTTPTGAYGFGPVAYGNQPNPGSNEPYHQLVCGDWWDADPSSSQYNTFQHVPCSTTPAWAQASEPLWTETTAYASFAVIDYNTRPVVAGAGSAIFLHASTGNATAGCVSIPLNDLDLLLRWMQPADSPLIAMGPASEISRF